MRFKDDVRGPCVFSAWAVLLSFGCRCSLSFLKSLNPLISTDGNLQRLMHHIAGEAQDPCQATIEWNLTVLMGLDSKLEV